MIAQKYQCQWILIKLVYWNIFFYLIWQQTQHKLIYKTILIIFLLLYNPIHFLFPFFCGHIYCSWFYITSTNKAIIIQSHTHKKIVKNPKYSNVKEHIDSWVGNPKRLHIDYKSILKWDRSIFKAALFQFISNF